MILEQTDLFRGMNRDFVKMIMALAEKEEYPSGSFIFRQGDPASHFYVLLKGQVRLRTGTQGQLIHTVSKGGELFGWSSIVGRDHYSASAECYDATKVVKFDASALMTALEGMPSSGITFMRRVARSIGDRLVASYHALLEAQPSVEHRTYGSSLTSQQRQSEMEV